jgi:hypothetical protein
MLGKNENNVNWIGFSLKKTSTININFTIKKEIINNKEMIAKEVLKEMIKDESYIKENNYFDFPHKRLDIFIIEAKFIIQTDMDAVTMWKQDLYDWATQWLREKNLEKLLKS